MGQSMLQYDVAYPDRLSRLLIFVKWLLIIPHFFILPFLFLGLYLTTFIAWFAILFTGHYPRGLHGFAVMTLRWNANISAYLWLQRDEYPPFGEAPYPVRFELPYPDRLSRWKIFVKGFMLIPHFIIMYILGALMYIIVFFAWWAILFTGKYPRGMFEFFTGASRWIQRVMVYMLLLTDFYPPFTTEPVPAQMPAYAPAGGF